MHISIHNPQSIDADGTEQVGGVRGRFFESFFLKFSKSTHSIEGFNPKSIENQGNRRKNLQPVK